MIRQQFVHLFSAILAVTFAAVSLAPSYAATIAHWSFDTPTITSDANGNVLTAADDTGNHNASAHNVGDGTTNVKSIAGQFGQAAQFNNTSGTGRTNYSALQIPNLTEITGPTGGSFTVAGWINTANTASNSPMLADWGQLPTNTAGNNNFAYWFSSNNVTGGNTLARAQLRNTNITTPTSGGAAGIAGNYTDIAARQPGSPPLQGAWHHLAWTWDKPSKTLRTYVDGVQTESFTSTQANVDLSASGYANAFLGLKQDNRSALVGSLDEVWVLNEVLSPAAVNGLRLLNIPVPEPSSVLLVLLGILPIGFGIRRRT